MQETKHKYQNDVIKSRTKFCQRKILHGQKIEGKWIKIKTGNILQLEY